MLDVLDTMVIQFFGNYAHTSEFIDRFVMNVLTRPSFKWGPVIMCLWIVWFSTKEEDRAKQIVVMSAGACFLALIAGRTIQNMVSERPRPLHSGNADFVAPYDLDPAILKDWSSFPSDHAAMGFALSVGILCFSRPLGTFCLFWTLFAVSMPRVYGGYHYASDILGGAVIGILAYMSFHFARPVSEWLTKITLKIEQFHRGAFYALMFFLSLQMVTMFDDIRQPIDGLFDHLRGTGE
jgi:membrane-associated phospholipid phosphatase